jgi:cold shock CspA family protein
MAQRGSHLTGSVTNFDERRGVGEIAGDDGAAYLFHCTVVADGSRTIAVGTAVEFERVPGHRGRWEAASIVPATPGDK